MQNGLVRGSGRPQLQLVLANHQMPTANWRKPHFWRMRAEEIRTLADNMRYPEPKAIMLRIAADYESLADALPEQTNGGDKPSW
jgi:hypothetical protein